MGTLSYSVTTFDGSRHRELAEFGRLAPAIKAATLALDDSRIDFAVVKDRTGALVYAVDHLKAWTKESGVADR